METDLTHYAQKVGQLLLDYQYKLVTAESCTGGGIAHLLTSVSGSSNWFDRGFITYSNTAKQEMLGVQSETLQCYGAVSEQTVLEMAKGALEHSHAQISLAITGIAGPTGGTPEQPIGTIWFASALFSNHPMTECVHFEGDRQSIRTAAIEYALKGLLTRLTSDTRVF